MARRITLKTVLEEIRKLENRLTSIEELIEEVIIRDLPKRKLTEEEITRIKTDIEEMKKGQAVRLGEITQK